MVGASNQLPQIQAKDLSPERVISLLTLKIANLRAQVTKIRILEISLEQYLD